MEKRYHLPLITLLLMISFASINAVLFTPALPSIATFFATDASHTQFTLTYYLLGYTLGQLLYGPLANRYGRKPTLYVGIAITFISSFMCVFSGVIHSFDLLVIGRFLLALGAGCGLKMTFTLVNECYPPRLASQTIAYLITAFAITPAIGVAVGGVLTEHFGWQSCFYASAVYCFILLFAVSKLPETLASKDYDALKLRHLVHSYGEQFTHAQLILGGMLMGCCTAFVYMFAALAPFIAINLLGMTSSEYGFANMIPACGMLAGSLYAAYLTKYYSLTRIVKRGLLLTVVGVIMMSLATFYLHLPLLIIFIPMAFIYFGLCLIIANASTIGLNNVIDKSHGSAVLSFINMGSATIAVIALSYFQVSTLLMPGCFIFMSLLMVLLYLSIAKKMVTMDI